MLLLRSINFIIGLSRSGDLQQTIQHVARGPRRLLVILVDRIDDLTASLGCVGKLLLHLPR